MHNLKYILRKRKKNRLNFLYDAFPLPSVEYAKIFSEINTNYGKYDKKPFAIHMSYGIDNKAYWYYFENHGYNNYNIYMRVKV